jgi:small ligand-binding sensory domain FIST
VKWASGICVESDIEVALTEIKRDLTRQLGDNPDLLLVFVTPHFQDQAQQLPGLVAGRLSPGLLLGCTATGVIGGGREIEGRAAVVAIGALLPDVAMTPFRLTAGDLPDLDTGPSHWHDALGVDPVAETHFLLLTDPGGSAIFDPRPLLMGLDFAYPGSTTMGGLASVLQENHLFLDDGVHEGGCVGVALQGNLHIDTIVAQGCRPIGRTMTVTDCSGHFLTALDERPAVEVLVELYHQLDEAEQELLQRSLHLGVAATGLKSDLGRGDFLMRDVMQLDHEKGAISVGDLLRNGQTVQFHLRDPKTAGEDLDEMLDRYQRLHPAVDPSGALLFTCAGRGRHFFGIAGHDSGRFVERLGDIPQGGFFCGGEIAPVGDTTYLHGYTAAFAMFRSAT